MLAISSNSRLGGLKFIQDVLVDGRLLRANHGEVLGLLGDGLGPPIFSASHLAVTPPPPNWYLPMNNAATSAPETISHHGSTPLSYQLETSRTSIQVCQLMLINDGNELRRVLRIGGLPACATAMGTEIEVFPSYEFDRVIFHA